MNNQDRFEQALRTDPLEAASVGELAKNAASALGRAYYHFDNAPGDLPVASALLAIAEQLALLNDTLAKMDR